MLKNQSNIRQKNAAVGFNFMTIFNQSSVNFRMVTRLITSKVPIAPKTPKWPFIG